MMDRGMAHSVLSPTFSSSALILSSFDLEWFAVFSTLFSRLLILFMLSNSMPSMAFWKSSVETPSPPRKTLSTTELTRPLSRGGTLAMEAVGKEAREGSAMSSSASPCSEQRPWRRSLDFLQLGCLQVTIFTEA